MKQRRKLTGNRVDSKVHERGCATNTEGLYVSNIQGFEWPLAGVCTPIVFRER